MPLSILLVEDNEMNREILSRRLVKRGYQVHLAMDGAAAISMAAALMPDIILMDLNLPVLDGWEATRRLKADPRTARIPVMCLTAHAMMGDRDKGIAAGCDEYGTKPMAFDLILASIQRLTGT